MVTHEHCLVLTQDLVPSDRAGWRKISVFARRFDGYQHLGERCGDIANAARDAFAQTGRLPEDMGTLRSCLFYEHRRYHHFASDPEVGDMPYIRAVVKAIRHGANPMMGG